MDAASQQMHLFTIIVREGGLAPAARALGMTPSAVSKALTRLEERLGVRLLARTTRAMALTPEGEAYHQAALRILSDIAEAEQGVAAARMARGPLRVSASVPFGNRHVVPLIPEFLRLHPAVTIDISLTDHLVDLVGDRADVAIRMGDLADSDLTARRLTAFRRVVVAAPDYLAAMGTPTEPEDLGRHRLLRFSFWPGTRSHWPFLVDGEIRRVPTHGPLTMNNGETMRQLTLAGAGIARVGYFHVAADIAAGRLVPLLEPFNPGDLEVVHALFKGGPWMPARVRLFLDFLADRLGGLHGA